MNSKKFNAAAALVCLSFLVLALFGAIVIASSLPLLILSTLALIGAVFALGLTWRSVFRPALFAGNNDTRARLVQEVTALNRHAMVTLTDDKARIVHVNDKFRDATGYALDDLSGISMDRLYFEDDLSKMEDIRAGLDRGEPWSGETRLQCKQGNVLWTQATIVPRMDAKGNLVGSISVRTDITDNKMAAAQKELYTALHKLWDEVYMFDPATLRCTYMNEAALARKGWSVEDYTPENLATVSEDFETETFRTHVDTLVTGKDHVSYTAVIDSRPYDIRLQRVSPYAAREQLVVVLRDMSERVQAERAQAELMSTISHELRTPMTSIKGAMGLLLSNAAGELPEKARGMLSIAYRNADRLVMIINDILDIEKIAAGQMEFKLKVEPLASVIEEAVAANEQFANRFDVKVVKEEIDPDACADYDFGRTLQVLTNLLSNAAKFSPPGGRVRVYMERIGDRIRINVQDYGQGIAKEAQARIFERFAQASTTANRGVESTGLGLNIAKVIMEEQKGSIGLFSELGKGATFYAEFPAAVPAEVEQLKPVDRAV